MGRILTKNDKRRRKVWKKHRQQPQPCRRWAPSALGPSSAGTSTFINRYRSGGVEWGDLATVIGVLGGAGILALFPAGSDLFGAYGIGLALGFFGYFVVLIILVTVSKNFDADWFLDGRRKRPEEPFYVPGEIVTPPRPPMVIEEDGVVDR